MIKKIVFMVGLCSYGFVFYEYYVGCVLLVCLFEDVMFGF